MMATLQRFGLADNKASAVARGIGERSPLAVMKLLERLRNDALVGRFPEEQRKREQVQTEGSAHDATQKSDLCQTSPR